MTRDYLIWQIVKVNTNGPVREADVISNADPDGWNVSETRNPK